MEQQFTIKNEFKKLIPSQTEEEKKLLEDMLVKEGVRHPLTVWQEQNILIDGHTRLGICNKHNLPYKVEYLSFPDEDHVIAWMIKNQSARRNLTPEQIAYLRGLRYKMEKKIHGGNRGNQYTESNKVPSPKNLDLAKPDNDNTPDTQNTKTSTDHKLAKEYGVSHTTIWQNEKFADAVDTLTEIVSPEIKEEILTGKVKISKRELQDIALTAQSEPEEAKKQYQEAKMKPAKKKSTKKPSSNIIHISSKKTDKDGIDENENAEHKQEDVNEEIYTCPICKYSEPKAYVFTGASWQHEQHFMKEMQARKPVTEAMQIASVVISRIQAMMPDDPMRIEAYETIKNWLEIAIEKTKQTQTKRQKRS